MDNQAIEKIMSFKNMYKYSIHKQTGLLTYEQDIYTYGQDYVQDIRTYHYQ